MVLCLCVLCYCYRLKFNILGILWLDVYGLLWWQKQAYKYTKLLQHSCFRYIISAMQSSLHMFDDSSLQDVNRWHGMKTEKLIRGWDCSRVHIIRCTGLYVYCLIGCQYSDMIGNTWDINTVPMQPVICVGFQTSMAMQAWIFCTMCAILKDHQRNSPSKWYNVLKSNKAMWSRNQWTC